MKQRFSPSFSPSVLAGAMARRRSTVCAALIELVRQALRARLLGGGQNRAVAGAATQVAGRGFVGLMGIGFAAVLLQGKQRHHKAGGTKAALRAMTLDHRLLHAVQLPLMLEVFDADQLLAVQRRHERQARIEAAITQRLLAVGVTVQLANHDGAGTAVTTGATFLGAGLVPAHAGRSARSCSDSGCARFLALGSKGTESRRKALTFIVIRHVDESISSVYWVNLFLTSESGN